MNEKSVSTLAHTYPVGCKLIAHNQFEPFPDAAIIAHLPDWMYRVEECGKSFDASEWYISTYYTIELPDGTCLN